MILVLLQVTRLFSLESHQSQPGSPRRNEATISTDYYLVVALPVSLLRLETLPQVSFSASLPIGTSPSSSNVQDQRPITIR